MGKLYQRVVLSGLLGLWLPVALAQNNLRPAPDAGAGMKRAAACFACHGADGISRLPAIPHLGGQRADYLEKALHAYREGITRQDPAMTAMAKPLSDADIANIAAYFSLLVRTTDGQSLVQNLETQARIAPIGVVYVATTAGAPVPTTAPAVAAQAATPRSGAAIYAETCSACHSTGAAGAPKAGDHALWAPRLAQGNELLQTHALQGFNAMPPKGGCVNCSDDEVRAAVEHLVSLSRP